MPSLRSSRSFDPSMFFSSIDWSHRDIKYKQSDRPIEMKMISRRSLKTNNHHECSPGWHPVGGRGSCSLPSLHHDHAPHLLLHHTLQHLHHLGEVSPPPRSSPRPQSPTTLIPLLKHNSTLGVPQSSKSRQNPGTSQLQLLFFSSTKRQKHQLYCPNSRINCLTIQNSMVYLL